MFKKILIANRGEIAVRVIKTARRMGIGTVAVYCDADRDALHVEMADEAVSIGPPPASKSYLVIDKIVDACLKSGADAVHPGYGFLSERAAFAEALEAAGVTFIGPNPKAIAAMGDKIESKKLAAAARVSTIPGRLGTIADEAEAVAVAREIGLPVMIKASAGGGGKGMRVARSDGEVAEGFKLARSEAKSSFGDDRIFIERYIENPRHIEIQILADKRGNVLYLGERECSIQRRNQKIVEEAPSPALDAKLRREMGEQAASLARAVGYDSAGTVEFVFGQDRRFYFLEMNTRLQVEHPVTELVTGLDLVEQMIRVAAGEPLGFRQEDVRLNGWAIESRLYAEDPYREFVPSIGRLNTYRMADEESQNGRTVRIDSGVVEGSEISVYFDPLIAKLVTHGPDRTAAIDTMAEVLDRTVIDGIRHNQPFLSALMAHRRWRDGRLSTGFIAEEYPGGFGAAEPDEETLRRLALVGWSIEEVRRARLGRLSGRLNGEGKGTRSDWVVSVGKATYAVKAAGPLVGGEAEVSIGGGEPQTVLARWQPGERLWSGSVDGVPMTVQVTLTRAGIRLSWRGIDVTVKVMAPRVADLAALMPEKRGADASKLLRCPMPGLVVAINATVGQKVRVGEALAVVEAMKMENVLRAERDTTVTKVNVKQGDSLAVDAVIMEFD
jgi:propionyl-CoA carboxylase alpha chain